MREPFAPIAPNEPQISTKEPAVSGSSASPGVLGVSIPDRRRIDSDVRAFLREPSTPWIVFDQEGRPPSQLAVGEVLPVAFSSVIPEHGFFPAAAIIDAAGTVAAEPSSLAVAADLEESILRHDAGHDDVEAGVVGPAPRPGLRRRAVGAAALALALVATVGIGKLALGTSSVDAPPANALSATPKQPSLGGAMPADVTPPDLAAPPAKVASASPPSPTATPPAEESPAKAAAKKFARLSIAGDARSRDVFLDGKRLLGRGARSFTVTCGVHAIAIGTRADVRDVDVPCNAELVLGK
jgi:hypothetical protein